MSRVNVRVDIPTDSPDLLLILLFLIISKHEKLGDKSPLKDLPMDEFKTKSESAKKDHGAATQMHKDAESKMQDAHKTMGIDEGQDSRTEGTLYSLLTLVRDQLLVKYKGKEEKLQEFGFNVVISESNASRNKAEEGDAEDAPDAT